MKCVRGAWEGIEKELGSGISLILFIPPYRSFFSLCNLINQVFLFSPSSDTQHPMPCIYLFSVMSSVRLHLLFLFLLFCICCYNVMHLKRGGVWTQAGSMNTDVENAKAQILHHLPVVWPFTGVWGMGTAFTELFSGSLIWQKEQRFYDMLRNSMGSESLSSIPPAQLPYNSLKDKSPLVYTLHGNGRWLAALNTHKPRRQWAYYYLLS